MMSSEPVFTRAFYSRSKDVCKYTIHWGHFLERRYDTDSLQSLQAQLLLYCEGEFLVFTIRRFAYSYGNFIGILKINYCPLLRFFHEKVVIIWFSNLLILSVPDEGYSRNASCALNLISTFLLHAQLLLKFKLEFRKLCTLC